MRVTMPGIFGSRKAIAPEGLLASRAMRAIRFDKVGPEDVLELHEVEVGPPGPGELRIVHEAIGVNFIDIYHRSGLYPLALMPSGIGLEAAGRVEAVGEGVSGFREGDRVAYAGGPVGAYADARVIAARHVVHVPDGVSSKVAAASLLKGMTAELLVCRAFPLRAGHEVLVHAAAGGVGLLLVQWAKSLGARVIGTVGSDAKAEVAREAGCSEVIVYTRETFAERARELTAGRGVDVVYDSVGKDTFDGSLASLAVRGTLVLFGNASGKPAPFDPARLAAGSFFLTRASLFHYTALREELEASAAAFFGKVADGTVVVRPPRELPLASAAEAHASLGSRGTIGSTVLVP